MEQNTHPRSPALPIVIAAGILCAVIGTSYGIHVKTQAQRDAEQQAASYKATVGQMQQQIQTLQERIVAQENKPSAMPAAPAATTRSATGKPRPRANNASSRPVEDPRVKQLEQRVAAQDKRLDETQQMVDGTRSDLTSQINSTAADLNGSIARTSEEVAALRRRGERDYVEFDLAKSKTLSRAGPVSLALRKTDTKHRRYNLDLLVDDNRVEKKNVNLLEPVFITLPEWPGPVELVVNRIDKDHIRGYVSTPKYKRTQLASTAATEASPIK